MAYMYSGKTIFAQIIILFNLKQIHLEHLVFYFRIQFIPLIFHLLQSHKNEYDR